MGNIDRIVYMPILTLSLPAKRAKRHGNEGEPIIKPLKQTNSLNVTYATGCPAWRDCLTCPDELASKCPLGEKR